MSRRGTNGSSRARAAAWLPSLVLVVIVSVVAGTAAAVPQVQGKALPEPIFAKLKIAFERYDAVRGDLAGDSIKDVPTSAIRLAGALRLALAGDDAGVDARVLALIEEAAHIADLLADADDLTAARYGFGEVSRLLMRLAEHDARLTDGWNVFVCPMADSFPRWMQRSDDMANPYMGPSMLRCGSASDWILPPATTEPSVASLPRASTPAATGETSTTGPEWKPGIPGLMMEDVRDHKFLWREIEQLQVWERGDRITVAEFRSKAIEKTAHFLGFGGSATDDFTEAATEAIHRVRHAFHNRRAALGTSGLDSVTADLDAAVDRLTTLLQGEPRHQLFEPDFRKWVLKLAFSPKEAKEAREIAQARSEASSGRD